MRILTLLHDLNICFLFLFCLQYTPVLEAMSRPDPIVVHCAREQWPLYEGCRFLCPEHSCVKPTARCVNTFDDCECEPWFKKTLWGTCEPDNSRQCFRKQPGHPQEGCDYECPENSCIRDGVTCVESFRDCECWRGFMPVPFQSKCVPKPLPSDVRKHCLREQYPPDPKCNFVCPENSCAKAWRQCIDDVDDCMCNEGYEMNGVGQCIPE